jgi:hypothetical protein
MAWSWYTIFAMFSVDKLLKPEPWEVHGHPPFARKEAKDGAPTTFRLIQGWATRRCFWICAFS